LRSLSLIRVSISNNLSEKLPFDIIRRTLIASAGT
jgi:hypothetical protein